MLHSDNQNLTAFLFLSQVHMQVKHSNWLKQSEKFECTKKTQKLHPGSGSQLAFCILHFLLSPSTNVHIKWSFHPELDGISQKVSSGLGVVTTVWCWFQILGLF